MLNTFALVCIREKGQEGERERTVVGVAACSRRTRDRGEVELYPEPQKLASQKVLGCKHQGSRPTLGTTAILKPKLLPVISSS